MQVDNLLSHQEIGCAQDEAGSIEYHQYDVVASDVGSGGYGLRHQSIEESTVPPYHELLLHQHQGADDDIGDNRICGHRIRIAFPVEEKAVQYEQEGKDESTAKAFGAQDELDMQCYHLAYDTMLTDKIQIVVPLRAVGFGALFSIAMLSEIPLARYICSGQYQCHADPYDIYRKGRDEAEQAVRPRHESGDLCSEHEGYGTDDDDIESETIAQYTLQKWSQEHIGQRKHQQGDESYSEIGCPFFYPRHNAVRQKEENEDVVIDRIGQWAEYKVLCYGFARYRQLSVVVFIYIVERLQEKADHQTGKHQERNESGHYLHRSKSRKAFLNYDREEKAKNKKAYTYEQEVNGPKYHYSNALC